MEQKRVWHTETLRVPARRKQLETPVSFETDSTISQDHTGGSFQRERSLLYSELPDTEEKDDWVEVDEEELEQRESSRWDPRKEPELLSTLRQRETRKRKAEEPPLLDTPNQFFPPSPKKPAKAGISDRFEQEGHDLSTIFAPEVSVSALEGQYIDPDATKRPEILKTLAKLDQSDLHRLHDGAGTPNMLTNSGIPLPRGSATPFPPVVESSKASLPQGYSLREPDNKSSGPKSMLDALLLQVDALKKENSFLQTHVTTVTQKPKNFASHPWIVVHKLKSICYFDAPQWKKIPNDSWNLESRKPIYNFEVFLEKQKLRGVAFVVTLQYDRHYTCSGSYLAKPRADGDFEDPSQPITQRPVQTTVRNMHVSIRFLCEVLDSAWKRLLDMDENLKQIYDDECEAEMQNRRRKDERQDASNSDSEASFVHQNSLHHQDIPNAEVFFYHFHTSIRELISDLKVSIEKCRLNLLVRFVDEFFREEYQEVSDLLSKGLVSGVYIKYLSAPGTVLISHENGNDIGYLQKSFFRDAGSIARSVKVANWSFDGKFRMQQEQIMIDVEDFEHAPKRIKSLKYCPLQYADPKTVQNLKGRGHKFWKCRKSAYVSYDGLDMKQEATYNDTRFLIDVRTYHTMHGDGIGASSKYGLLNDALMDGDEPPADGSFVYALPASIYGFDMQEKQWVDLQVGNIRELEWNTEAFESLAIDKDSKELINALVNNKIAAEKATDMVRGKGNGLIILLHGGPGTGKTLTAESVAEIAKKPLYRVTCGDIGTEPREVEKYLQKVFHLGKIWDCVVLLDEADVFLEQRTLSDLSRNALVSVFLRTLEYYDGILILTSNRVGTFDEAFKSRIQLALHYPNLTFSQRKQIWENLIHRLDSLEEDVDTDAILASINKLAKYEMNGRQIRNAITTARQLALFKKETLTTKHLEHSIRVSGKFDQYLEEVHDQIKDDEMARQNGFR